MLCYEFEIYCIFSQLQSMNCIFIWIFSEIFMDAEKAEKIKTCAIFRNFLLLLLHFILITSHLFLSIRNNFCLNWFRANKIHQIKVISPSTFTSLPSYRINGKLFISISCPSSTNKFYRLSYKILWRNSIALRLSWLWLLLGTERIIVISNKIIHFHFHIHNLSFCLLLYMLIQIIDFLLLPASQPFV
jgi:hypothetical protein